MENNNGNQNNNNAYTTENQEELSDEDGRLVKRKRYHRHSQQHIQEMDAFFKECPHPDDTQRKELSRILGLDPIQIKFWFQNKRTQNKNHQERHDNTQLRKKNDKLKAENQHYQEAIANASCPKCGENKTAIGEMSFEEHNLRRENGLLQEQVHQLSAMAEKYEGKMAMTYPVTMVPTHVPPRALEMGMGSVGRGDMYGEGRNFSSSATTRLTDVDKSRIIELAVKAMEELMKMAQAGEPLWIEGVNNGSRFALNLDEYKKTFPKGLWPRPTSFRIEASKETVIVAMNPTNIVEKLMNVDQWSTMFAGIVARGMALEVLATGATEDFSGALQLMDAEFQVLSPLVSNRRAVFARYCEKQGDGVWAVVDVSIDHIFSDLDIESRRRPSGCLVQKIQNGYSKVTWVEHVEIDDRDEVHNLFRHLVSTGQALGANRWITTLSRQCERLNMMATTFASNEHDGYLIMSNQGKGSLLKLGERMVRSFFGGITTSTTEKWSTLSGYAGDNIMMLTRTSLGDQGRPPGVILCAATSFWIPAPSNTIFDFLRDEKNRTTWDAITLGGSVSKLSQIVNGRDRWNCVSLLWCTNADDSKVMIIQESSTDPTASFVVYAPIAEPNIDMVVHGGDSDYVALLPSGFVILPDGTGRQFGGQGGSLLTIALQILVDQNTSGRLNVSSVATIENLMLTTMQAIKSIFRCPVA